MAVDRAWLESNLGGPPQVPPAAAAVAAAAEIPLTARAAATAQGTLLKVETPQALTPQLLARERIEFDSQTLAAHAARAAWPAAPPSLKAFVDVAWPNGLAPTPATEAPAGDSLPQADVLIVTWTVDEGHALSRVLTPGFDSAPPTPSNPAKPGMGYWKPYTKGYDAIAAHMNPFAPARHYHRLGTYWTASIGSKKVVLFKSDSHMSQDGPEDPARTPNRLVWQRIIEDCKPKWVITTGTAGGIGPHMQVGDVVVSRYVTFDPGGPNPTLEPFSCKLDAPDTRFEEAHGLFAANAEFLPKTNKGSPRIVHSPSPHAGIVTTRGFQYDDTANKFHLKGKGDVCEMGDAVLGLVCRELGSDAPDYAMVRNVSDPEIDSADPEAPALANFIYEHFGRWSSVCSAITCWGIVAAL